MNEKDKLKDVPAEIKEVMKPYPEGHYCPACGARTHLCWCGTSRPLYRDGTEGR